MLDDFVNKYNSTVHRTMKMEPIDVTFNFFAEYNEDSKERDPKFKVGDRVRRIYPKLLRRSFYNNEN